MSKRTLRFAACAMKAVAVAVVVSQLTAFSAFCVYGADGIARWDSWRPAAFVSCAFLAMLAGIQYMRRRRESRRALAAQAAASLCVLAIFCVLFAMGKGLLTVHLQPPLATAESAMTDGLDIVEAARRQIGVTLNYDCKYTRISYPGGDLPHIMVVSNARAPDGTPLVIHNIGSGVKEDNDLFSHSITGHFRLPPSNVSDALVQ